MKKYEPMSSDDTTSFLPSFISLYIFLRQLGSYHNIGRYFIYIKLKPNGSFLANYKRWVCQFKKLIFNFCRVSTQFVSTKEDKIVLYSYTTLRIENWDYT